MCCIESLTLLQYLNGLLLADGYIVFATSHPGQLSLAIPP